jgi:hypothetical protein
MVRELAERIQKIRPEISVSINQHAAPDKRSYKVDFGLFKKLAPDHQPLFNLDNSIKGLIKGLDGIGFDDADFRNSSLMRLNVVNHLLENNTIDKDLRLL